MLPSQGREASSILVPRSRGKTPRQDGEIVGVQIPSPALVFRQGYRRFAVMYYVYILRSSKSGTLYYGYTTNLKTRLKEHNKGKTKYTKGHIPWKLVWYCAFVKKQKAKDFELYLKSGSGKAFVYKRLVNVALEKDVSEGTGVPKL